MPILPTPLNPLQSLHLQSSYWKAPPTCLALEKDWGYPWRGHLVCYTFDIGPTEKILVCSRLSGMFIFFFPWSSIAGNNGRGISLIRYNHALPCDMAWRHAYRNVTAADLCFQKWHHWCSTFGLLYSQECPSIRPPLCVWLEGLSTYESNQAPISTGSCMIVSML